VLEKEQWVLGQLLDAELSSGHLEGLKIETSVFGRQKSRSPGAITLMLLKAIIFIDKAVIIIRIKSLLRYLYRRRLESHGLIQKNFYGNVGGINQ
jgi:hypothetical protein